MTDNEIIKALDDCQSCEACAECDSYDKCSGMGELMIYVSDLINRQKAEIAKRAKNCTKCAEKSTKTTLRLQEIIAEQKAEIERLKEDSKRLKKVQMQLDDLCIMHHTIRAEAIKEFCEKAKPILDQLVDLLFDDNESNCIVVGCNKPSSIGCNCAICVEENKKVWRGKIDDLVKEMVGDNNDSTY